MIGSHDKELLDDEKPDLIKSFPFFAVCAIGVGGIIKLGSEWWFGLPLATNLSAVGILYVYLMLLVVTIYHRYYSHRSYKVRPWFAKVMAFLVTMTAQKDPSWWASHHRLHHRHSDTEKDVHSAWLRGLYWAHCGWILCSKYQSTVWNVVLDLKKSRWLRFLNRPVGYLIGPVVLGLGCFALGVCLGEEYGTSGWSMLLNFFVAITINYHATFSINSLAHMWGTQPHNTGDQSRNNFLLALLTLGEGWHNNHHHDQGYEPQGQRWWQIDIAHYVIMAGCLVGLVTNINLPKSSFSARFLQVLHRRGLRWVPAPLSS